jgi:hypothetical protein
MFGDHDSDEEEMGEQELPDSPTDDDEEEVEEEES